MSSIFYKEKIDFFFLGRTLDIQWSLCYKFIHVYFIKFSNENIGLNTILTIQFQTYLFLTFIIPKFLKFCSWYPINPIEGSIVSKWNLSKIWIYFLVFSWKIAFFLTWYFFNNFFYILYHAFIFRWNIEKTQTLFYFKVFTKTTWFLIEFPLVSSLHDIVAPFNYVPSDFRAMVSTLQASSFSIQATVVAQFTLTPFSCVMNPLTTQDAKSLFAMKNVP